MIAILSRLERDARLLALLKLGNVALAMAWGFAVTFVFVRLLPLEEFRAFLLLVAFANFTISADFGFSGILYARLRRHRLVGADTGEAFHPEELGALAGFMGAVVLLGGAIIAAALATGLIPTARPGLFLAFYALAAMNIFALLARRVLAALDHNGAWELLDALRRALSLALLLASLGGLAVLVSVLAQIGVTVIALAIGFGMAQAELRLTLRQWLPGITTAVGVWRRQLRDMGATMALTASDVAAYHAPYFALAIATRDPRPLLVFDFVFKLSRALTAAIRALVEAALPRFTEAWHGGARVNARKRLARMAGFALAMAAAVALVILVAGERLSAVLFDGKAVLAPAELVLLGLLLPGLAMLCVSTYVHNAIGRFPALLVPSFAFLAGSVLCVPAAAVLAGGSGARLSVMFLALYALVHLGVALRHVAMLRGLGAA